MPGTDSVPSCDCTRVSGGLLTKNGNRVPERRDGPEDCDQDMRRISAVFAKTRPQVGPDGTLVSGSFCDGPLLGQFEKDQAPASTAPDLEPCLKVHGPARSAMSETDAGQQMHLRCPTPPSCAAAKFIRSPVGALLENRGTLRPSALAVLRLTTSRLGRACTGTPSGPSRWHARRTKSA